jgi:Clp amino terminal domain, pathogenicity island component
MEPVRLDDLITMVRAMSPDGSALDRLTQAVQVSENLGELADHLVGHFVDQARRAGASWTDIGHSMGVTKQAAQKRFVPRADESDLSSGSLLTRFTPRARQAVVLAQEHARTARNELVEPEHVLLGLLDDDGSVATRALVALGADPALLRTATLAALARPADVPPTHIPFSPRAKKLLQMTAREALRLGHNYIGTEHILLGLLADDSVPAGRLLAEHDIAAAATQRWVLAELKIYSIAFDPTETAAADPARSDESPDPPPVE